jgi:ABC-type multidrug transport system fused ATPase/permease subunit
MKKFIDKIIKKTKAETKKYINHLRILIRSFARLFVSKPLTSSLNMQKKLPHLEQWQKVVLEHQSELINNAEFAYWSAALTFNVVIITVFTVALSVSTNQFLTISLVILSLVSAILLVMNFRSRTASHRTIMRTYYQDTDKVTNRVLGALTHKRQQEITWIDRRERCILCLFAIQCILTFWLLLSHGK